ncbi:hypothetical protein [Heyndrickxia coagulans]|uniref:hypothetical protein n=1 Tax=Heyndrickxia coagulans TaxID=1398 RepID=UPI0014594925|nr:hypothetical protein [Heyndrickxia coagulans]
MEGGRKGRIKWKLNYKAALKVDIPWRRKQRASRNKQWELDRLYHAAIFYKNVIAYRNEILNAEYIKKRKTFIFKIFP